MKRDSLIPLVIITLFLPVCTNAFYKVIDLGTLGGNSSAAYSINENGQIVGGAYNSSLNARASLFDPTGGGANIDLGTLGGTQSWASSINDSGQIVGDSSIGSTTQACIFDPTGGGANKNLGTLGGYPASKAKSINNNGQIVGYVWGRRQGNNTYERACLFDPRGGGVNINLGTLGGEFFSEAYSINNNGQIVGGAHKSSRSYHACLFDPTGGGANIDLGALSVTWNYSVAYSINNRGDIVGFAYNNFSGYGHACLFDSTGAGANIDLGTLGGNYSEAHSINDAGQIVGMAQNNLGYWRATLFDPTGAGNNIDLNSLIDPSSGWNLWRPYSINNNGWIVGRGINPDGFDHAFLLIPEPATLLLFGIGAILLRKRR